MDETTFDEREYEEDVVFDPDQLNSDNEEMAIAQVTDSIADKILGDTGIFKPKKDKQRKTGKERKHPKEKADKPKKPRATKADKPKKTKEPKKPKEANGSKEAPKGPKAIKESKKVKEPSADKPKKTKEPKKKADREEPQKKPKKTKRPDEPTEDLALATIEDAHKQKKSKKNKGGQPVEPEVVDSLALVSCVLDKKALSVFDIATWPGKADVPFAKAQKFCKSTQKLMSSYMDNKSTGSFVDNARSGTACDKVPDVDSIKFSKEAIDFLRLHTQVEFENRLEVWSHICKLQGKQTLGVDTINCMMYFMHSGGANVAHLSQKSTEQLLLDALEHCYTVYPDPTEKGATAATLESARRKRALSAARYINGLGMDSMEKMKDYDLSDDTIQKCIEPLCYAEFEKIRLKLPKGQVELDTESNEVLNAFVSNWGLTTESEATSNIESQVLLNAVLACL